MFVGGILIILCNALANLSCGNSNDRIGGGCVAGISSEDFDAQRPLLDVIGFAGERVFDYEAEEVRKATALIEIGAGKEPVQFVSNGFSVGFFDYFLAPRH